MGLVCVKLYLFRTLSNKSFKVKLIFKYFKCCCFDGDY